MGTHSWAIPRGNARQTDLLDDLVDDGGLPRIFGAGANHAGPGNAGPACATDIGSDSAASSSGPGACAARSRAGASPAKKL